MNINKVLPITAANGTTFKPAISGYDKVSEGWTETEYRVYETASGSIVGSWQGEPGRVYLQSWPYTEVCVIRSGRVRIEDDEGNSRTFGPGEHFLVPAGFSGWWITLEPTEKLFVAIMA